MNRLRALGCSLVTAVLIGGCSRPATPVATSFADSAGPRFVTASGDTITMTAAARIGGLDVSDAELFTRVNYLVPAIDGGIIVADDGADSTGSAVRQFDAAGRFVRRIGRVGDGPGEYDRYVQVLALPRGQLLIGSQASLRVARYDSVGQVNGTWSVPSGLVDLLPADDGGWYTMNAVATPVDGPRPVSYFRFDSSGVLRDTIPASEAYRNGPNDALGWGRHSHTTMLPDGTQVASRTDSFNLSLVGAAGATRRIERDAPRPKYTQEQWETRMAQVRAAARQRRLPVEEHDMPKEKQAHWYMVSDDAGRILLLLNSESRPVPSDTAAGVVDWRSEVQVDVHGPDGVYRGRLLGGSSARSSPAVSFTDNAVWLLHEGESGEQYVVRWVPSRVEW